MAYRNVYEDKYKRGQQAAIPRQEPERDPKKRAEIYRRNAQEVLTDPTTLQETDETIAKIHENEARIKRAKAFKRSGGGSILNRKV